MTEILIIFILVFINGIFAMAEIALVSARKTRLELSAKQGDEQAKKALELASHPDTFLSTVQIGITLATILTGIFAEDKIKEKLAELLGANGGWLQHHSHAISTVIVVICITYLSLISELVGKKVGLSRPERISKLVAAPMRVISTVAHPFVVLLSASTSLIASIFKIRPSENNVTEEEIKAIINEGTEAGAIEEKEQEIIERIFHLGDRNITSLMTHRTDVVWMELSSKVADVKQKMHEVVHTSYPVCDGAVDNIKGIVHIKDLLLAHDDKLLVELMKPAVFVPENNTVYQVLEKFKQTGNSSCFIVDEYGSVEGMITLNDILEAIVGDIGPVDEDDYEIIERHDGSFLVDAQIPFYDFLSKFEKTDYISEGEQDFNTVAGFILHQLKAIPKAGDRLEWKEFKFEIMDMDGNRIDKVLVELEEEVEKVKKEKKEVEE